MIGLRFFSSVTKSVDSYIGNVRNTNENYILKNICGFYQLWLPYRHFAKKTVKTLQKPNTLPRWRQWIPPKHFESCNFEDHSEFFILKLYIY